MVTNGQDGIERDKHEQTGTLQYYPLILRNSSITVALKFMQLITFIFTFSTFTGLN